MGRPGCSGLYAMCLENLQGWRLHSPSGQLASIFICIVKTLFLESSQGLLCFGLYLLFLQLPRAPLKSLAAFSG